MGTYDNEKVAMRRRNFLGLGVGLLPSLFGLGLLVPRSARASAVTARSCVWLWMNGGPSHIDTFDPKPGAKGGGPFKALRTRARGVEICEHLPQLGERAGKFGRTPKINANDGRDHHPAAFSVLVGGGGVRGGQVVGRTDSDGGAVVERPVGVPDLIAMLATLMG